MAIGTVRNPGKNAILLLYCVADSTTRESHPDHTWKAWKYKQTRSLRSTSCGTAARWENRLTFPPDSDFTNTSVPNIFRKNHTLRAAASSIWKRLARMGVSSWTRCSAKQNKQTSNLFRPINADPRIKKQFNGANKLASGPANQHASKSSLPSLPKTVQLNEFVPGHRCKSKMAHYTVLTPFGWSFSACFSATSFGTSSARSFGISSPSMGKW